MPCCKNLTVCSDCNDYNIWEPVYWYVLECVAYNYPKCVYDITFDLKSQYDFFYKNMKFIFPVQAYNDLYVQALEEYNLWDALACRDHIIQWVTDMHTYIKDRYTPTEQDQCLVIDDCNDCENSCDEEGYYTNLCKCINKKKCGSKKDGCNKECGECCIDWYKDGCYDKCDKCKKYVKHELVMCNLELPAEKKYCNPKIWGPFFWYMLDCIGYRYPKCPSESTMKFTVLFFKNLKNILPCNICKRHYCQLLKRYPIERAICSNKSLYLWIKRIQIKISNVSRCNKRNSEKPRCHRRKSTKKSRKSCCDRKCRPQCCGSRSSSKKCKKVCKKVYSPRKCKQYFKNVRPVQWNYPVTGGCNRCGDW